MFISSNSTKTKQKRGGGKKPHHSRYWDHRNVIGSRRRVCPKKDLFSDSVKRLPAPFSFCQDCQCPSCGECCHCAISLLRVRVVLPRSFGFDLSLASWLSIVMAPLGHHHHHHGRHGHAHVDVTVHTSMFIYKRFCIYIDHECI